MVKQSKKYMTNCLVELFSVDNEECSGKAVYLCDRFIARSDDNNNPQIPLDTQQLKHLCV